MATDTIMPPVHPGEILTEFLEPLELSQYQLARSIAVPARRISEIVHGRRRISASTTLRLARYFVRRSKGLQVRKLGRLTWAFIMRAGDENRTRTVSLGIYRLCSNNAA
jgi:addiction module HigA family antidote